MPTQIELLKKYGLSVQGHIGQHLLIDANLQRKIVDLLSLNSRDKVFEIGPGLGALSAEILSRGARLVAVEKDKKFAEILEEELALTFRHSEPRRGEESQGGSKFKIVQGNALEVDWRKILKKRSAPKASFKFVSNLPYYISTPILFKLIENRDLFSMAVLTVQKEVAERILAVPGSKDYSRLTLGVGFYANAKRAFNIPPSCFSPRPEVESTALVLTFKPDSELPKIDQKLLFHIIQTAFSQRRKTLLHLLGHAKILGLKRAALLEIFKGMGLPEKVRGEELWLKDYLALAKEISHGVE